MSVPAGVGGLLARYRLITRVATARVTILPPSYFVASNNMGSACYTDPSSASCKGFARSTTDWSTDLASACGAAPESSGCTLWAICKADGSSGGDCTPSSLAADVCGEYSSLPGCQAYAALCKPGSVVAQCTSPGPTPSFVNTTDAKQQALVSTGSLGEVGYRTGRSIA